jgi:hypothetical protein
MQLVDTTERKRKKRKKTMRKRMSRYQTHELSFLSPIPSLLPIERRL